MTCSTPDDLTSLPTSLSSLTEPTAKIEFNTVLQHSLPEIIFEEENMDASHLLLKFVACIHRIVNPSYTQVTRYLTPDLLQMVTMVTMGTMTMVMTEKIPPLVTIMATMVVPPSQLKGHKAIRT